MVGGKQMKFCGAVARALLFGVKFGGFGEGLIGRSQIMDKLQFRGRVTGDAIFDIILLQ